MTTHPLIESHQDLQEPPKFRFRVIRSFKDAMTRQISEAVRIELRGEGVLNSKSEYSRCRLPRLVIDHDGWKKSKQEEKKNLESGQGEEQKGNPGEDCWEEWASSLLEDESDLERMRRKTGSRESKRKAEDYNKPAKRKKMEKLMDWGAEGSLEEEDNGIRKWLLGEDKPEGPPPEPGSAVREKAKSVRMKQLEIDFSSTLNNSKSVENVPEGWNPGKKYDNVSEGWKRREQAENKVTVKKRMTIKQLAKVNKKMTNYFTANPISVDVEDNTEEFEIDFDKVDERKLERLQLVEQEKRAWANSRMITELLRDMIKEVPARVEIKDVMDNVMKAAWSRITRRLEAKETAAMMIETIIDQAWWRFKVEDIWKRIEMDGELKRVIMWRLENLNLENKLLVRAQEKKERLLRKEEARKQWWERRSLQEEQMDTCSDWKVIENHEHEALNNLMRDLGMDDDMEDTVMDFADNKKEHVTNFDEELEHSYLDEIIDSLPAGWWTRDSIEEASCPGDNASTAKVVSQDQLPIGDQALTAGAGIREQEQLIVNIEAYRSGGTWWLNNWLTKDDSLSGNEQILCKGKLGCACSTREKRLQNL